MTSKPESLVALAIGHSTRTIEEFVRLLQAHAVTRVVDVRTVPRSRHNPQFNRDTLPASLKTTAIGYTHMAELGGLRRATRDSILILASERNLQKFSSLCQAQYRKPTGGFFAAFTQSGSTASVSASMASSCGRYQMTAAMLTNNTSLPISSCTKGTKRSQAHSMIFGVQRQSFKLQSFENSV